MNATDRPGSEPPASTAPSGSDAPSLEAPEGIPDAVWTAILDDLSQRLGEPVADVTVVSATAETWNDGSLGCPRPGEMYTQALVDGYQVVLEIDGQEFDYRTGSGPIVRLCEGG